MKKSMSMSLLVSVIVTLVGFGSVAFAVTNKTFSSAFKKNFKNCEQYSETFETEYKAQKYTISRYVLGWRNGFCRYEEIYKSPEDSYKLNCSFSDIQVDELSDAMRSRSKELLKQDIETFVEQKDPKTGEIKFISTGSTQIRGTKGNNAWAKYLNNPYFCRPEKIKK